MMTQGHQPDPVIGKVTQYHPEGPQPFTKRADPLEHRPHRNADTGDEFSTRDELGVRHVLTHVAILSMSVTNPCGRMDTMQLSNAQTKAIPIGM